MNNKKAIVLGGTIPHITLLTKLKTLGFKTILIDYLDNPPAKDYADLHIKASTLDKEVVYEIAKENKVDLIISACVDQANVTACYVSEKLALPHPYSYETSLKVTDKRKMKSILMYNNIPTANYYEVNNIEKLNENDFDYPLMVKPADSNSANGVKKVNNFEELIKYGREALAISRTHNIIIEEFMEGKEISAYFIIKNKIPHLIMTQERISAFDGKDKVIKCFASHAPAEISESALKNCLRIAKEIAIAFGLDNTPLFFQGIVKEDEVKIIEFAPRVGGGISSQTILEGTGFDMIEAAINSYLGIPISTENWHPLDYIYSANQIYGNDGFYAKTEGYEILLQEDIIERIAFYKEKGSKIKGNSASSSRIGVMIIKAHDNLELLSKIKKAFTSIDSFDINGKSIIRKDLNLYNYHKNSL